MKSSHQKQLINTGRSRRMPILWLGVAALLLSATNLAEGKTTIKRKAAPQKSKSVLVEPLFFNMREITITPIEDAQGAADGGISETVSYTNGPSGPKAGKGEMSYDQDASKLDTTVAYQLTEIRVKAEQAYTTERDGKLVVRMNVNIPRQMLSSKWRLLLEPEMRYADTVVKLPLLQFKGYEFLEMQQQGYKNWDNYLKGIINPEDYDKHFVDSAGVNSDIAKLQQFFFKEYNKEVKEYKLYLKRKQDLERKALEAGMRQEIKKREQYLEQIRQNDFNQVSKGSNKQVSPKTGKVEPVMPVFNSAWRPKNIPKKYAEILARTSTSSSVNQQDSVFLASRRYKQDEIVRNEMRDSLKSSKYKELIPYPYLQGLHTDTTVGPLRDLKYLYEFEYPSQPGMQKLRVSMTGKIEAIDMSSFVIPPTDTIEFNISTIDQLLNEDLAGKRTKLYRNVYSNIAVYPEFAANSNNVDTPNNRSKLDTIVACWRNYRETGYQVDSVILTATTSLEGNYDRNNRNSQERVNSMLTYLMSNAPSEMNVGSTFRAYHLGEDWAGLLKQVRRNPGISDRQKIVTMITTATNPDATEKAFKTDLSPADYKIISQQIYPSLNKVDVTYYLSYPGLQSADSVVVERRPDYDKAIKLFKSRNYWDAMDILSNYPDYNLALCMTALGFNDRAYDLLQQLEQNADVEYLSAIVCYRMNMKGRAEEHLLRACELDKNKIYRAPRDQDIKALIDERDLQGKLDELRTAIIVPGEETL